MKVKEIMTRELFFLHPDRKLDLVEDVMGWHNIRHIPVVDKKRKLLGIITHRDLLGAAVSSLGKLSKDDQKKLFQWISAEEIMHPCVITASPETDVRKVAQLILENKVGCIPVVESDGTLVGIVTEADFVKLALETSL